VSLSDGEAVVLEGEDHLAMQVGEKELRVSAGSFFQTNFSGARALAAVVSGFIRASGCRRLLDVYCGVGLFSTFLAREIEELAGIESSPSACRDFAFNLDEYDNVRLYQGMAEDVLPLLDFQADSAIVDPPRAGLHPRARQALLALRPQALVYVSCNPATLARDLKHLLESGYHLEKTVLVDMFPHTYHIESVVLLYRNAG